MNTLEKKEYLVTKINHKTERNIVDMDADKHNHTPIKRLLRTSAILSIPKIRSENTKYQRYHTKKIKAWEVLLDTGSDGDIVFI